MSELRTALLERCTFDGDGVLEVACSGGPDSSALAVLAAATGRPVVLHHVDHGLRAGSTEESAVVKALAERLGAGFVPHLVEVGGGPNLEARARTARLGALPPGAATGHSMDDQAETVLLNLLRGAGSDGLAGMRPGGHHPVLGLRRAELAALCEAEGLEVVIDPTNAELDVMRNRVRHQVLPLLCETAGRDVVPLLARSAGVLREESEFLELLALETINDPTSTAELRSAPRPLAVRRLRGWVRSHRADRHPPSTGEVARLFEVVEHRAGAVELSGGLRVERSRGQLRVEGQPSGTLRNVSTTEASALPVWAAAQLGEVVVPESVLQARIAELGAQITADYADNPPLLVGVLKGALHFLADLSRSIELPIDIDFMAVSSYGSATKTSGIVRILKDLDIDLTDRHVLVVEDIIDSGLTLNYLRRYLSARGASSIEVCALLVKEADKRPELDLRYIGFDIPRTFVVGYGLDVAERYRNLRTIYAYVGDPSA
jgi:hypoxanthine phosphoribosyltransferase